MDTVIATLQLSLVQRALLAGVLVSLCASLLGVILVLKRYSLIGHGLGDVGFAAVALAVALGLPPLTVSMPIVIVASFFIMFISQKSGGSGDAAIGIVSTGALSAGVIITSLAQGFNVDITNYMFGSILSMTEQDVLLSVGLSVVVLLLFALFYNRLFLITYDETYARSCGINVTFYQFFIAFLTALTVVIGMRMMGTLLISSLVIFPAMTAKRLFKSFRAVVAAAAGVAVFCFVTGMLLSLLLNLPTGASVVMVNVAALLLASCFSKIVRRA